MVGLGQCSLDQVATVTRFPRLSGKERLRDLRRLPGGQVATALLAGARLGLKAALVGSVGRDAAAGPSLAPLEAEGVDVSGVRRVEGAASQSAWILVEAASGERTVFWHRDPRLSLEVGSVAPEEVTAGRVLLLDAGDPELALWAAEQARARGIPTVLDADTPGPGSEALLRAVDFPVVSEGFAEEFCAAGSPERAARELASLGARFAVVTLGDRGAVGFASESAGGGGPCACPAFPVEVRDTTGAGDAFHGAFVWGLLQGCDAGGLLRVACAVAALNCRAPGAQGGLPSQAELKIFLGESDPEG